MKKRHFVLVVVDRDTGEFTVEGPLPLGKLGKGGEGNVATTLDATHPSRGRTTIILRL